MAEQKKKVVDFRPHFLFDTVSIATANATTEFYFFRTPEGKTTLETNLQLYSSIPVGWIFEVSKMRLIPNADITPADLSEIFGTVTAQLSTVTYLKDGDTEIFTLPAIMLNAGCGVVSNVTTAIGTLGIPSNNATFTFGFPLTITGGRTFSFKYKFGAAPTPAVASKIQMVLEGILKKEVVGA